MELVRKAGQKDNEYSKARRKLEWEAALAGSALNGSNAEELEAVLPCEE
jgi:thiamine biosynthesis protein ThiC